MTTLSSITSLLSCCSLMCTVAAFSPSLHSRRFNTYNVAGFRSPSARKMPIRPSMRYTRLSRLFLDAYEEQYRKYLSAAQPEEQTGHTIVQRQQQSQTQQTQTRRLSYMPGGTQQYLQQLSSPAQVNANGYDYYESSVVEEVDNPNPYADYSQQTSEEENSYDLQYQQYLEDMRQHMMPEAEGQEAAVKMEAKSLATDRSTEISSRSTEEQAQQDQHVQDVEESFLRTLSNEVNYKKFLGQSPFSLTDINIPLIIQRFLDNIEDGQQKRNGKLKGLNKRLKRDQPRDERKTVVVLGTGWAAHSFIKLASTYDLRIVVVSPVNHFVFTPMLASAAVGTVEYRSMTEPIRVTNPCIDNYVEGRAIGVDVEGK